MTLQEFLKLAPGIIGVLGSIFRVLPRAAVSARQHQQEDDVAVGDVRVLVYTDPPPWPEWINDGLRSPSPPRDRLRARSVRATSGAAIAVPLVLIAYLAVALEANFPWWSILLATLLGVPVTVALIRTAVSLNRNKTRATAALPATGSVRLRGQREDVYQYSIAGLRRIGARLVSAGRSDSQGAARITAAAGLVILGNFFGEFVEVTIASNGDCHEVRVHSLKMDWITPSRSKRNVTRFLELWAAYPTKGS
jgi:hypothetical protein